MSATATMPGTAGVYVPHLLHGDERTWPETNCYVDLWIELLHARGLEPRACLAFTLGLDYEGDQYTFYKPPLRDLRALYGIEVQELNIWRPLTLHAAEQCALGRVLMPEVDAFYLPDTAGVSYRNEHGKTTIGIASINVERYTLQYFHGRGLHTLGGNDFAGLFRLGEFAGDASVLPPFAEIAKLDGVRALEARTLVDRAMAFAKFHLAAAPRTNPIARYAVRLADDLAWLRHQPLEVFHHYAFATVRQAGSCFELASAFLLWLDENGQQGLREAASAFVRLSTEAKTVQFKLARMARLKRDADIAPHMAQMAAAWDEGMSRLTDRFAR
jgi:hypothetical protein